VEGSALLIGATGLIGRYVQEGILKNSDCKILYTLVRNSTNGHHQKLLEVTMDESRDGVHVVESDLIAEIGSL
jgi:thioester reductase-like protein